MVAVEKAWKDLTPAEKWDTRLDWLRSTEGIEFASAEAEEDYRARVERFVDVIELERPPDRVPVLINATFMQTQLYGVTPYDVMYDQEVMKSVYERFFVEYQPDFYFNPALAGDGRVLEILDYQQYRWPGRGVPKNSVYQYVEGEYMLAEEYQELIDDPSDFWIRRYLPRMAGALDGLKLLPPFTDVWEIVCVSGQMVPFGIPAVQDALRALIDAGTEAMAWVQHVVEFDQRIKGLGFVSGAGGLSKVPFDLLADTLRGTKEAMIDLHRRPDLVIEAVERLTPIMVKQGVSGCNASRNPIVFIPLHKGADGFMSDAQFQKFYWPGFKALVEGLVAEGCIPCLFFEGGYNSRLEYLQELPKGKCLGMFDKTDPARAKQLLGDTMCLAGFMPAGLIVTGTPEQVRAHVKMLVDTAGKDGGYIMAFGTAMDDGRPETVHAMIDFTKEYGVYR